MATTKPGAFCLPTACPLHSHLLEAQDECLQAGLKLKKLWGLNPAEGRIPSY